MADIRPGTIVQVKVVKKPTSAAAAKTIVRLLSKDAAAKVEDRRLRQTRKKGVRLTRRGGRIWRVRLVKQRPVKADPGATGTITATVDVLTDLASVSRFVEVSPA